MLEHHAQRYALPHRGDALVCPRRPGPAHLGEVAGVVGADPTRRDDGAFELILDSHRAWIPLEPLVAFADVRQEDAHLSLLDAARSGVSGRVVVVGVGQTRGFRGDDARIRRARRRRGIVGGRDAAVGGIVGGRDAAVGRAVGSRPFRGRGVGRHRARGRLAERAERVSARASD